MRKILVALLLLILMFCPSTSVAELVGTEAIDYLDDSLFTLSGNITLVFDSSTPYDESDITLIRFFYSTTSDITLYQVISNPITYDHTFVNDTKNYGFFVDGTIDRYLITVDYSSIDVPTSIEDLINISLAEKDEFIIQLAQEISVLEDELDVLNETIAETEVELAEWKSTANLILSEKNQIEEEKNTLAIEKGEVEDNLSLYKDKTNTLTIEKTQKMERIKYLTKKLNEATDAWGMSVNIDGEDKSTLSWISFIIGIISVLIFLYFMRNRFGLVHDGNKLTIAVNTIKKKMPSRQPKTTRAVPPSVNEDIEAIDKKLMSEGITREIPANIKIDKEPKEEVKNEPGRKEVKESEEKATKDVKKEKEKSQDIQTIGDMKIMFVRQKMDAGKNAKEAEIEWKKIMGE